jgi:nicotinamidase-related amidase
VISSSTGFFEVDGRELANCGDCLAFVPRALRFQKRLEHLESRARHTGSPFVYTICCADRFLESDRQAESVVVPLDRTATAWIEQLPGAKRIHLEKPRECGDHAMDAKLLVWDMFLHNANAPRLFEALQVRHWVVYGIGIDHCVSSAAKGLLHLGYEVTVLSDVLVSNAGGNDATRSAMLTKLHELGARIKAYDEFLASFEHASE